MDIRFDMIQRDLLQIKLMMYVTIVLTVIALLNS